MYSLKIFNCVERVEGVWLPPSAATYWLGRKPGNVAEGLTLSLPLTLPGMKIIENHKLGSCGEKSG